MTAVSAIKKPKTDLELTNEFEEMMMQGADDAKATHRQKACKIFDNDVSALKSQPLLWRAMRQDMHAIVALARDMADWPGTQALKSAGYSTQTIERFERRL